MELKVREERQVLRGLKDLEGPEVLMETEDLLARQELQVPLQVPGEPQVLRALEVPLELELRALVARQDQEVETRGLLELQAQLDLLGQLDQLDLGEQLERA